MGLIQSVKDLVRKRLRSSEEGFLLPDCLQIQNYTSWQRDGETMVKVSDFILGGSKITADGDCSHEIKRRLLLGRKTMTNLDSIIKRDITLLTKVHLVKAMVFPVVMCRCESWTIKKAEHQRIDAIELWCWRRESGIQNSFIAQKILCAPAIDLSPF